MELLLSTANPIMIIIYILTISLLIYISRKTKKPIILIFALVVIIGMLIFHSVTLDKISSVEEGVISHTYHCIAVDLVLILITFISYLWIDDIIAKEKHLKSYDDSLSWFWNKI